MNERPREASLGTWTWNYNLKLIGKDKMLVGKQVTDLPARSVARPPRANDLNTWTWKYNPLLIGKDKLPTGKQVTDLPPRDPREGRSWTLNLLQSTLTPTVAAMPVGEAIYDRPQLPTPQIYGWAFSFNLNLVGKDQLPPGEQLTDLPPRAYPEPATRTWVWAYPLVLIGQDAFPPGDQRTELSPRAYDYAVSLRTWTQNLQQTTLQSLPPGKQFYDRPQLDQLQPLRSWTASYNLNLIAQDAFPPGDRITDRPGDPIFPNVLRTWLGLPVPTTAAARPFAQYDWPLSRGPVQPDRTWVWSFNLNLIGQDFFPTGEQRTELPPRGADRANDLRTWVSFYNLNLIGKDALPVGEIRTELARGPLEPATRTWAFSFNPNLIAQDQFPPGEQKTDLPQRGPERAIDLRSWTQNLLQSTLTPLPPGAQVTELPPRAHQHPTQLRTWTWSYNVNLISQDALPVGGRITDLPPRAYDRANDLWTWIDRVNLALNTTPVTLPYNQYDWPNPRPLTQPDRSFATFFNPNLIAQDAMTVGARLTDRPGDPLYPTQLRTWIGLQPPQTPKPFSQTDWPNPRGPLQPDRTWVSFFNFNLIGQDQLPVGDRIYELPPVSAERSLDLRTWIAYFNLNLVGKDVLPAGKQVTDLPPRAYPEPATRTWAAWYNQNLTGQDVLPPGEQRTDLPPRAYPEPATRTWVAFYNVNLIAQDKLPVGAQVYDRPQLGHIHPASLRTWTWQYNFNLIAQDQLPVGVQVYDLSPRGAQQPDRTWIVSLSLTLNVAPGPIPFNQYDWPLPTIPLQPDRSFCASYNKNLIAQDKLPVGTRITDLPPLGPLSNLTLRGMVASTPITLNPPPTPTAGTAEWIIRARRRGRR